MCLTAANTFVRRGCHASSTSSMSPSCFEACTCARRLSSMERQSIYNVRRATSVEQRQSSNVNRVMSVEQCVKQVQSSHVSLATSVKQHQPSSRTPRVHKISCLDRQLSIVDLSRSRQCLSFCFVIRIRGLQRIISSRPQSVFHASRAQNAESDTIVVGISIDATTLL